MFGRLGKTKNTSSKATYITVSYLMVILIAVFDYITNPEFSFSLFYIVPISYNTWYTGRKSGLLIAFISAALWLLSDLEFIPENANMVALYWNSAVRLGVFLVVVFLLSEVKYLNRNLEKRVEVRTTELTEQINKKNEAEKELIISRNLYRDFVENINEVYFSTDENGYFKYISPNFYKVLYYEERTSKTTKFYDIIYPEDKHRIITLVESALKNRRMEFVCEFRIQLKNRKVCWFEQSARIMRGQDGIAYEIRSLLRDITERKDAEISLLRSEMKFQRLFSDDVEEMTEAEFIAGLHQVTPTLILKSLADRVDEVTEKISKRVKQAIGFSSLASHELRTPLAIIRNLLEENLRADVSINSLRETTASVYDEVLRLQRIIGDLLKISTMEAGKFILHKEIIQLDEFLSDFHEEVLLLSQDKEVDVKLCVNVRVQCNIDRSYFLQMMFNVFDNALKYTPHSGEITIGCNLIDNDAQIMIRDNGPGISQFVLENLFKDFYQNIPESKVRGTGLGLILSKWIAELHNGTIRIESTLNEGTTVFITVPVVHVQEAPLEINKGVPDPLK